MPTPQSDRSRRRAPAACTPCRRRHAKCIWSPLEGSPVRCQRCRERELECVYEPTSVTGPPPASPVVPVLIGHGQPSSHMLGSGSVSGRGSHHVGAMQDYQLNLHAFNYFTPRQQGQGDNMHCNPRGSAGQPFGQPPAPGHPQSPYSGTGPWRMPGTPSLVMQASTYHSNYTPPQTNGLPSYQSSQDVAWPASPTDSHADPFFNLLSQSPVHSPMLDPPSRF